MRVCPMPEARLRLGRTRLWPEVRTPSPRSPDPRASLGVQDDLPPDLRSATLRLRTGVGAV